MNVPFTDFQTTYQELKQEPNAAYESFVASGRYAPGDKAAQFEGGYAANFGATPAPFEPDLFTLNIDPTFAKKQSQSVLVRCSLCACMVKPPI